MFLSFSVGRLRFRPTFGRSRGEEGNARFSALHGTGNTPPKSLRCQVTFRGREKGTGPGGAVAARGCN